MPGSRPRHRLAVLPKLTNGTPASWARCLASAATGRGSVIFTTPRGMLGRRSQRTSPADSRSRREARADYEVSGPGTLCKEVPWLALPMELVPPGGFDGLWNAEVRGIVYRRAA